MIASSANERSHIFSLIHSTAQILWKLNWIFNGLDCIKSIIYNHSLLMKSIHRDYHMTFFISDPLYTNQRARRFEGWYQDQGFMRDLIWKRPCYDHFYHKLGIAMLILVDYSSSRKIQPTINLVSML